MLFGRFGSWVATSVVPRDQPVSAKVRLAMAATGTGSDLIGVRGGWVIVSLSLPACGVKGVGLWICLWVSPVRRSSIGGLWGCFDVR